MEIRVSLTTGHVNILIAFSILHKQEKSHFKTEMSSCCSQFLSVSAMTHQILVLQGFSMYRSIFSIRIADVL